MGLDLRASSSSLNLPLFTKLHKYDAHTFWEPDCTVRGKAHGPALVSVSGVECDSLDSLTHARPPAPPPLAQPQARCIRSTEVQPSVGKVLLRCVTITSALFST
eukprot:1436672-Prymnesium_polylepis.1